MFAEFTGTFTVACECSDSACLEMIEIAADAYERVRESPYTFVVLADHVDHPVERVVSVDGGYAVVEMPGASVRALLEQTAPPRARDHAGS